MAALNDAPQVTREARIYLISGGASKKSHFNKVYLL
ncbi:hypothetical protein NEOC95_000012 [Neochlamydia sp. AcF95]|nr:hypothetical protein [Neochlamydia sp. AcF95]